MLTPGRETRLKVHRVTDRIEQIVSCNQILSLKKANKIIKIKKNQKNSTISRRIIEFLP